MGRNPVHVFKKGEFEEFCRTAKPLNPRVYYSPITNKIVLSFDGNRIVDIMGGKGIFFTKGGYLTKSYTFIGELI